MWICSEATGSISRAYHCSDRPGGGNFRVYADVNERSIATTTGAIRKARHSVPPT
jgi:hypothetical protein